MTSSLVASCLIFTQETGLKGEKVSALFIHTCCCMSSTLVVVVKDSPMVVPYQEICCAYVGRGEGTQVAGGCSTVQT